jgi:hypothetical protein
MALYTVETKLTPEQAIQKAVTFFGEEGVGLDVEANKQSPRCAYFEGGGGYVRITVVEGERTTVELETREWDYDAKRFVRQIGSSK